MIDRYIMEGYHSSASMDLIQINNIIQSNSSEESLLIQELIDLGLVQKRECINEAYELIVPLRFMLIEKYNLDRVWKNDKAGASFCPNSEFGEISNVTSQTKLMDEKLVHLWGLFDDIPINEEEEIEEDFLVWPTGTDRFEIWKWFDVHHSKGITHLIVHA